MAKVYNKVEEKIRDWLAQNLSFIEPDLVLIETEYHLPDSIGSKGYIDILAKDKLNNFVIIEVKRADSSSRQAINEILKYHALLKQNYNARESEIRIIIISTHWSELIRPFSELVNRTSLSIKGFEIAINNLYIPKTISLVKPISSQVLSRKFSPQQCLDLFFTESKRENFILEISKRLKRVNYNDYVIIELDNKTSPESAMYNYASVVLLQELDDNKIMDKIKIIDSDSEFEAVEDYETIEDYTNYLHEEFICQLDKHEINDSAEAGYPEKLDGLISEEKWSVKTIHRYGTFSSDPRYDDEILLREARGLDGNNSFKFLGMAESTQPERMKELIAGCQNSLKHSINWQNHIVSLLGTLQKSNEPFRIGIYIYNPNSTLQALNYYITKGDKNYLPYYQIFVSYIDSTNIDIYSGHLVWNGKIADSNVFQAENQKDEFMEFMEIQMGWDNDERVNSFELLFANAFSKVINGKMETSKFIIINNDGIEQDPSAPYYDLDDGIEANNHVIMKLVGYFLQYFHEIG